MDSYVINLAKRPERLEQFMKKYDALGPQETLIVIRAIDGSEEISDSDIGYIKYIDVHKNDYESNPRIMACAMSHMKTWSEIIKNNRPGIIFEDDVYFREDGLCKNIWSVIKPNILQVLCDKPNSIIYIGAGDTLPLHTNLVDKVDDGSGTITFKVKAQSLYRAQEKAHVCGTINNNVGEPNTKSAYLFDWFGAFAYCINPDTAKYLFEKLSEDKMKTAVDVYLKNTLDKYVVVPLMAYHGPLNLSPSDIRS